MGRARHKAVRIVLFMVAGLAGLDGAIVVVLTAGDVSLCWLEFKFRPLLESVYFFENSHHLTGYHTTKAAYTNVHVRTNNITQLPGITKLELNHQTQEHVTKHQNIVIKHRNTTPYWKYTHVIVHIKETPV